jgi:cytochrome c1
LSGPLLRRLWALASAVAVVSLGRILASPHRATIPHVVEPARGFALQPAPRRVAVRRARGLRGLTPMAVVLTLAVAAALGWKYGQVDKQKTRMAAALVRGDPSHGPALILRYGCAGCHDIEGVPGPKGQVGPSLTEIGKRVFIAGRLENTPQNLVRWIQDPKTVDPNTAMPRTGISEAEARDVAAYLLAQ